LQRLEWPFRTHSVWRSSAQQSGTEPRRLLFYGILRQANYHSAGSGGGRHSALSICGVTGSNCTLWSHGGCSTAFCAKLCIILRALWGHIFSIL
jgi:hypothetical protein